MVMGPLEFPRPQLAPHPGCLASAFVGGVSEGNRVCIHGLRKLSASEVAPMIPSKLGVSLLGAPRLASCCMTPSGSAMQGELKEPMGQVILNSWETFRQVGRSGHGRAYEPALSVDDLM